MKISRIVIIPSVCIAMIILSIFIFRGRAEFSTGIVRTQRALSYPDLIEHAAGGKIWIAEDGWKTLTRIDRNGQIDLTLKGGSREAGSFYEAWYITSDRSGFLYIVNVVRNIENGTITKEEIQRYTPDGIFDTALKTYTYDSEDASNPLDTGGRLIAPKIVNGSICYLYRISSETTRVMSIDILSHAEKEIRTLSSAISIVDAVYGRDFVIITDKNGRLIKTDRSGMKEMGAGLFFIPSLIDIDGDDLYITDLGRHTVSALHSNGTAEIILSRGALENTADGKEPLFRSLSVLDKTVITVDESNNRITGRDADGKIFVIDRLKIHGSAILRRICLVSASLLLIIMLIISLLWFYRSVLNRRVPLFLKLALIFMPVFILSIAIISSAIFRTANAAYEEEIQNKLALLAQTGTKLLDGNALDRLTSPSQYRNADYLKLQSQITDLAGDNRDAWDKNLYGVLYKNYGGIYYYTVDISGYYGVLYPLARIPQSHTESFKKGTVNSTRYKDLEGEWICATAPVKNSRGEIVGVYEVGSNFFLHKELRNIVIRKLIIGLSIASAIQLGLFLLVSYFMLRSIRKLNSAGKQIAQGNFDVKVSIGSRDEIEDLGNEFNFMAEQIRRFIRELESKNESLLAMDRLKDEFLANTSHELRTPLHGIIGLAEAMIDGAAGEMNAAQNRNIAMIFASGRRLLSLVNDILDFAQLRNSEITLARQSIDVRAAVDVVMTLSSPLAAAKKLRLENSIPDSAPLIMADENRIMQILHNLIGNAIKFSDKGTIEVSQSCAGGMMTISVKDDGIGIAPENQEMIFESFEQLDGSETRSSGGTGLGLAVTKKLVELHGGEITVVSGIGKGSTFSVTVPLCLDPSMEKKQAKSSAALNTDVARILSESSVPDDSEDGCRILAVDDDPINLEVIANHLKTKNYSVTTANNGSEALSMIGDGRRFDLVLLDIMMPRLSGYEVARSLREKYQLFELPIIMLTAKNRIQDIVAGFENGANDYLAKPFNKQELLTRVQTLLSLKKAVRESARLTAIDQELSIAREIQMSIMPKQEINMEGLSCASAYIPMESVGGDFYDYIIYDKSTVGIIIADVTGHGIPAALISSMMKVAFHFEAASRASTSQVIQNINRILTGKFRHGFLTACFAVIDLEKKIIRMSAAAHPPLLIRRKKEGTICEIKAKGRIIGFMPEITCETAEVQISSGDRIIFYTDGITEARNAEGVMLEEERFYAMIEQSSQLSSKNAADTIVRQVREWSSGRATLDDDLTLVIVDIL